MRGHTLLLAAAAALAACPAAAQDTSPADTQATDTTASPSADTISIPPATTPVWTATVSGGVSARDNGPNGNWQALSLSRQIGRGYVRGALMRYHGTLLQADTALPSDYFVGTLAAGGNFHDWVTDGWISYGRQKYGEISTSGGSRSSTGATGSPYYAVGADFGKVLRLGHDWYLTPTVAGSYAHGKLLRPAPTGSGDIDLETEEPTWSANAAIRLDHAFGVNKSHYVGLSLSRDWTSNAVSTAQPIGTVSTDGTFDVTGLRSTHYSDYWFEVGATANMELTQTLHLDVFATRGFGMLSGDTTSAGIALRKSF